MELADFVELVTHNMGSENVIGYITIDSTGDATDFGDVTIARGGLAGCDNNSRGIFAGGSVSGVGPSNLIDYVEVDTTGNATDFGDLTVGQSDIAGGSGD